MRGAPRWILALTLLSASSPAPAHAQAEETRPLYQALEREAQVLRAEREALHERLASERQGRAAQVEQLEQDIQQLTRRYEARRRRAAELERELAGLEARIASMPATSQDPQRPSSPITEQAMATLRQRGATPPPDPGWEGPRDRLRWIFTSGADLLRDQSQITVTDGHFFGPQGRALDGRVLRVGEVAAVGSAGEVGGALAPAPGSDALQLVVPAPEQARQVTSGQTDRAPVLLFDPSDPRPIEVFEEDEAKERARSWRDTLEDAAPLGWVIAALGALALLVALYRALRLIAITRDERRVGAALLEVMHTHGDDAPDFAGVVRGEQAAVARITRQALAHKDLPLELYEDSVNATLLDELGRVSRGLTALRVIAAVSPLLGLLGTVVGMIATFDALTAGGAGDPAALSGGIAQALATTQLGLVVAVPALLLHGALASWAERMESYIEHVAVEISIHIQEMDLPGHDAHARSPPRGGPLMEEWIVSAQRHVTTGGALMAPLVALGVVLWVALTLRWLELWRGWRGSIPSLADALPSSTRAPASCPAPRSARAQAAQLAIPRWRLHGVVADEQRRLSRHARLITAITVAAPIMGLLGTVSGMIETFDALGSFGRAEQAERIAAGISKALITTEFGLFLAIPGLLVGRALERREARLGGELDELEALLASRREDARDDAEEEAMGGGPMISSRRRRRPPEEGDDVNLSPLIDVTFLLLIFFVVTSTFTKDQAVEIERPSAQSRAETHRVTLRVALDAEGNLYLEGAPIRPGRSSASCAARSSAPAPRTSSSSPTAAPAPASSSSSSTSAG